MIKTFFFVFISLGFSSLSVAQTNGDFLLGKVPKLKNEISLPSTNCTAIFADKTAPSISRPALQAKTVGLCFEAFALMHSGVSRTPLWAAQHLTRDSLERAREINRSDVYHSEAVLPPQDRAKLADYENSGFDRGQMAPAADMPSKIAQDQSFSLSNIVPQERDNNRNLWAAIESATRYLTMQRGEVYVITGPFFEGEKVERINGRVFVPTHFFKAVYDPQKREAAAWVVSNQKGNTYQVLSIAQLEKRININLFPSLPLAIKENAAFLPEPKIRSPRVQNIH